MPPWTVTPCGESEADCFIVLPHDWGRVELGTLVDVQPFFGLV
jgi:molybdopterin molybdotransferase